MGGGGQEPGLTLLRGVNVGDSGLTLCRRPAGGGPLAVAYKTNPQMHYFNCPFQLGGSSPGACAVQKDGRYMV